MPRYEYKVIPAPKKPGKIKGVKGTDQKFAVELGNLMNEYGAEGWEYQRADTLPCEERQGLTGRTTTYQNMLVFRREINAIAEPMRQLEHFPEPAAPPVPPAPVPPAPVIDVAEPTPPQVAAQAIEPQPEFISTAAQTTVHDPLPEPVPDRAPEPAPMAVPTFRSAAMAPASGGPKLSATSDIPEGKAPPIAAQ